MISWFWVPAALVVGLMLGIAAGIWVSGELTGPEPDRQPLDPPLLFPGRSDSDSREYYSMH